MANVFIHFEPIGPVGGQIEYGTTDLPPYLIPGSPDEANWRSRNPQGHTIMKTQTFETGSTEAHRAARDGNLKELQEIVDHHEEVINSRDINGWLPLHEAVRRGNVDLVKFLIEKGSDVNARTGPEGELGGSVMYWAKLSHGDDHPVVKLLEEYNAKHVEPGVRTEL
jgi:ankyrin repeat protein